MEFNPFYAIIGFLAVCSVIGIIGIILAPWIKGEK